MRYVLVCCLLLASVASGATVSTMAGCYFNVFPGRIEVYGTYSAACAGGGAAASASISFGSGSAVSVDAHSHGTAGIGGNIGGAADATFSAQFLLTLTGGTNLPTDYLGAFALFTPCLIVQGYGSYARLTGSQLYNSGSTCGPVTSTGWPLYLNVPRPVVLELHAHSSSIYDVTNFARFTGQFLFVDWSLTPLNDVTYTFISNDRLPQLPMPEPSSLTLIAAALLGVLACAGLGFAGSQPSAALQSGGGDCGGNESH